MGQARNSNAATDEALAALDTEFRTFTYRISHDLGAPLRNALQFANRLRQKYGETLDERANHYLEYVIQGAEKAQAMLEGLLQYSRIDTESEMVTAVDMLAVLEACQRSLREKIMLTRASITSGPLPKLPGKSKQFELLLHALLDNALTFTREGVPPIIHIRAELHAEGWRVTICDNGIGIAPQHCKEIFDPFRRLHAEQTYPGIGMGLTLAGKIAQRHGGRIEVESTLGSGTQFHLILPAAGHLQEAA